MGFDAVNPFLRKNKWAILLIATSNPSGLDVQNIVICEYIISNGTRGNGARTFSPVGSVGGYSNVVVSTLVNASGGSVRDDIQKINETLDVKAIVGKATSPAILEKANISELSLIHI